MQIRTNIKFILIALCLFSLPRVSFARRAAEEFDGTYSLEKAIYGLLILVVIIYIITRVFGPKTDKDKYLKKLELERESRDIQNRIKEENKKKDREEREAKWQASRKLLHSGSIDGFKELDNYRVVKYHKPVKSSGGQDIPTDYFEFQNLSEAVEFYDKIGIERDESKCLVLRSSDPNTDGYDTSYEHYNAVLLKAWWTHPTDPGSNYYSYFPEQHPLNY